MNQIQECRNPGLTEFWREYASKHVPVVIRGAFSDMHHLSTPQEAVAILGSMPVVAQIDHAQGWFAELFNPGTEASANALGEMAFGDFVKTISTSGSTRDVVAVMDAPPQLLSHLTVPAFCAPPAERKAHRQERIMHVFLANAGGAAHLHFDRDHRHVLLAQLFGQKRVALFPPAASALLAPINNFSLYRLEAVEVVVRDKIIDALGGSETVLEPGDAVYIPPLVWHYIEYCDLAMSFNVRFWRSARGALFSSDNFVMDGAVQLLCEWMRTEPDGEAEIIRELARCYEAADGRSRMDIFRETRALTRRLINERGLPLDVLTGNLDHYADLTAAHSIERDSLYGRQLRSQAPCEEVVTPNDVALVEEAAQRKGYTSEMLQRVLAAKYGAASATDLLAPEAKSLLSYLSSVAGSVYANSS